jgi:dTDP-4-dehydrorhamnose 3,5-epimerase
LKGGDGRAVLIGNGLGHGFISLEDNSTVSYLLSSPYSPTEEFEINPMDPAIGIDWQLNLVGGSGIILSAKDANAPSLSTRLAEGKLPS